jgi:hypothetical protein
MSLQQANFPSQWKRANQGRIQDFKLGGRT